MIYYLNNGFILEQALADLITRYVHRLRLDNIYKNFHISVTNDHPFAHLIVHEDATNVADEFPSIVITTQNDSVPGEFQSVGEQIRKLELSENDIDVICSNKRIRTYINDAGKEVVYKNKKGEIQYETIPGYCIVTDDSAIKELKDVIKEKNSVFGMQYITRKRDRVSIEIWAENNQLKNELYEQLRLFISTSLSSVLRETYKVFDPTVFANTVSGERSNNYNFDFDTTLYGAHITFDVDYTIAQLIIDTDVTAFANLEWEVINHVKKI